MSTDNYQRDVHRVHLITYHLIWCPRCRKPVLVGEVKARCEQLIREKCELKGYTPGVPLVLCPACGMRGHADRNASLVIGKRLVARYQTTLQEKPLAPLFAERESKDSGVADSQEPETEVVGHSSLFERHGILNGHGTAQEIESRDGCSISDMPPTLRRSPSWGQAPSTPISDYRAVSEAPGL